MKYTAEIAVGSVKALSKKVEKANKRARKLGLPVIAVEVSEPFVREYKDVNGRSSFAELVSATLTGDQPVLGGGWHLVAKVARDEGGAIIVGEVPGETMPAEQRERIGLCDQCGKTRARTATFVIQDEAGETKQVGRNCLADFMGSYGESPEAILNYAKYIADLVSTVDELSGQRFRLADSVYPVEDVVRVSIGIIERVGWVSRAAATEGRKATASEAQDYLEWPAAITYLQHASTKARLTAEHEAYKARIEQVPDEKVQAAIAWALGQSSESEYMRNLQASLLAGNVGRRAFGTVVSLYGSYMKAMEREDEIRRERESVADSEHIGTVGERVDLTVTIKSTRAMDSDFGVRFLVKADCEGNVVTTFYSGRDAVRYVRSDYYSEQGVEFAYEPGTKVQVRGTIKAHNEYQGVKETLLARCKFEEVAA